MFVKYLYAILSGNGFGENEGHELLALYFIHHFFLSELKKIQTFFILE